LLLVAPLLLAPARMLVPLGLTAALLVLSGALLGLLASLARWRLLGLSRGRSAGRRLLAAPWRLLTLLVGWLALGRLLPFARLLSGRPLSPL